MAEQGNLSFLGSSQLPQVSPSRPPKSQTDFEESGRPGKRPRLQSPPHMTAAAALAEERRHRSPATPALQSPNPQAQALGALMGINQSPVSPASENAPQTAKANPATTMSQPLSVVAENLQSSAEGKTDQSNNTQTSPVTSVGTISSVMGPSGSGTAVASPQPMDASFQGNASGNESVSPQDTNKATSYPNFLQPQGGQPNRGQSLPNSGLRQGTKSPSSNKKHRCPYCSTEFTRHHNLKSHLLTHSQEKPYVCSTCSSRFRRLHDLKRHTKLHTGERPHVCSKCNRKFARGDALARHNKGPGGCAGRRASMGSFGGDDDAEGDETMDGVVYGEPENMDDDESAIRGTPRIIHQAPSGDDSMDSSSNYRMPSTYPPIQGRPPGSFPPPSYGANQQPLHSALQQYGGAASSNLRPASQVYAQNPMTESPKPIPPAQRQNTGTLDSISRNRSPSNPQYAQPYPPRGSSGTSSLAVPPHGGSQLPPPHNLNPPDPRYTLASQAGPTHPPTQPSGPPTHMSGSGPLSSNSNSSHGFSGHGSGEGHKGAFPTNEERLWAVVRSLEQQMGNVRETIDSLRAEVANLRDQQQQR